MIYRYIIVSLVLATMSAAETAVEAAWRTLSLGVKATNAARRKEAITACQVAGRVPRAVSFVEDALSDKDVDVRVAAVMVLGNLKSTRSISKLKAAMDDAAPEVSFEAARALWAMGDYSGRDILMAVAAGDRASSSGLIKEQMRDAMKKLHNPAELAMIGVKEGAGAFLGPFGIGILVLEELRKDGGATARTLSVAALATDSDPKTIEVIADALQDKNWVVRAAAAKALAFRGDVSIIPKLEAALGDKQDAVGYVAGAAIIRLDAFNRRPAPGKSAAVKAQPATSGGPVKR
jgi:HEAT repeat protein